MRREYVIINEQGVHARPATHLVAKANEFKSSITVTHDTTTVDMKSIMGVLSLAIHRGALIVVETKGPDEVEAMDAIDRLIKEFNMR
ncbi:MAG: HPr family phosphocarrier protein [Acholeplasmatales bacterium]|nr:MAG: HPr family phosphocarrier protein [Acholeplasmatales bacterium]